MLFYILAHIIWDNIAFRAFPPQVLRRFTQAHKSDILLNRLLVTEHKAIITCFQIGIFSPMNKI